MPVTGLFVINNHNYTQYVKQKTGISWERENTNEADAGRDAGQTMHPSVTSHQRKLEIKMGPMPFSVAQQLETDLENGDEGVSVTYPDIKDGICTRLFYNTSVKTAITQFTDDGILVDDITFTLVSIKEDTL